MLQDQNYKLIQDAQFPKKDHKQTHLSFVFAMGQQCQQAQKVQCGLCSLGCSNIQTDEDIHIPWVFLSYSIAYIPIHIVHTNFCIWLYLTLSDSIWLYLTLGFAENKQKQIMSVIHVPNLEWLWWLATIFKAIPSYPWLPSGKLTICSWMYGHWNSWSTQL